ncbi:MAG: methyltransferase family protein [Mycobacterium sp.]
MTKAPERTAPDSRRRVLAALYGVGCHTLFVVAIATMMAAMFSGMSRSVGTVPRPWNWLANGALLVQFPLMHSFLLTERGRAVLGRLAPRGAGGTLSTTTYVIVAAVQVFVLFAFWSPTGTVWWQAHGVTLVAMAALYGLCWLLLLKSMWDAGLSLQTGTLGWLALFRGRRPVYPPMPVTGLFRMVRQPIYVSFTLTLWTVPTWTPDQLVLAVTLTLYCLAAPLRKEARFRRIYGEAFDRYARAVPYWLPLPRKGRSRL